MDEGPRQTDPRKPRTQRLRRCPDCRLTDRCCICPLLPSPLLRTRTAVTLLTHHRELRRSSNTGRLVERTLEQARVRLYGMRDDDPTLAPELAGVRPVWVLAPGPHAEVLGPADRVDAAAAAAGGAAGNGVAPRLVLLDGTWRQASRWLHRRRATAGVRWVRLPEGPPSQYRLRKELRPGRLSTLEATARALAILEPDGARVERQLLGLLAAFVDRSLWMRGLLPADEVRGGVPRKRRSRQ